MVFLIALFFRLDWIQAQTCGQNQYVVKAHFRKAYTRTDGTSVRATNVKDHCRDKSIGFLFAENKFKNSLPEYWPHKQEKGKSWSIEERERLVEALDDIPNVLFSKQLVGFYRAERSKDFPNQATHGIGDDSKVYIVLYDNAFSFKEKGALARILVHELAHQAYEELKESEQDDYRFVTNWLNVSKKSKKKRFLSREDGYVRDDGRVSPEEDFANNLEFFLFEPETLKRLTPHAHRWIGEHFGVTFKLRPGK